MSKIYQPKREEAIQLITYDPSSRTYVTNDEALEFLSSVNGPMGVISVAGLYRTGKSYLLNRMLLNKSSGFGVGPTVNPCTKGLWIWNKPLIGQTPDGETLNILIIDSEGIGALDEDSNHDSRIFAMAILLSSCFIYNSVGSIDENALQNLSLVANLTKNIHIKSQNCDEIDLDDYSNYFPSFVWVVRDFTLQLVDSRGDPISSKEYLERALGLQRGFSEGVEAKNRIRTILSTLFKERDCVTLVRPLTNEENLQNLDKMEFDQLRPEFFEQVINLRKGILGRMKPKRLNGKNLNGDMFAGLVKSYVYAINHGAVPNIENAWTYICKNECQKACEASVELYNKVLKESLYGKLPLPVEDLKIMHKMSKDMAIAQFKKKSVGDVSDEFFKEVLIQIKKKFQVVKSENEKESQRVCFSFIHQEFITIEKKLKQNEYKTFAEFERDTKLFYTYFMENGPRATNKHVIILEFLHKIVKEGAGYFIKNSSNEAIIQKTLATEIQKKHEQEIKEIRDDSTREKTGLISRLGQLEAERGEAEVKIAFLNETAGNLKAEMERVELKLRREQTDERTDMERRMSELKARLLSKEDGLKEIERQSLLRDSEHQKEKALFTQKITFLEKALDELNKKEKDQSSELKLTKKENLSQIKENSLKYEMMLKSQQTKINEFQERILDLENELATKEQKFDMERKKWILNERHFNNEISENSEVIAQLQKEVKELKLLEEKGSEQLKLEKERVNQQLRDKLSEISSILTQRDEELKTVKSDHNKELAVLKQRLEFQDVQLRESQNQLFENKKAHESIVKALETNQQKDGARIDNKQFLEMKEAHAREIRGLESDFEAVRKRLTMQIEHLNEKNNELELKLKFEESGNGQELQSLREQLEESELARQRLIEQNKNLDAGKLRLLKDSEERYVSRIKALEKQLEEQKTKASRELKESQQKAEEGIAQLRNFYEVEKERLEKRLVEEKQKYEKRIEKLTEEHEERTREEHNGLEEEIENLRDELREQEGQSQGAIQQYEHELALRQQSIDNLEKNLKETKESLYSIQTSFAANTDQQQNLFSEERKALGAKIESLSQELTKKEKEILTANQKKEYAESMLAKREQSLENSKVSFDDEKKELLVRLEEAREKLQRRNDEFLTKKIESDRELALTQQQNEFSAKKIEDLLKENAEIIKRYEEKLRILKSELSEESFDKLEKLKEEKMNLEQKYEKVKKTLRDVEATYNTQLSQLEREKAVSMEKLTAFESRNKELSIRVESDSSSLNSQLNQLRDSTSVEKLQMSAEVEKYRTLFTQLEHEKAELLSGYERDRVLWEGKFSFLEQQKSQAKQELADTMKKFELTLHHLKRMKESQKDEQENNLQEMIAALEQRHQDQLKDINEAHQKVIANYEEKMRKLEKEVRACNDRLLIDAHGKIGNQAINEKKLVEFMDNEKRLGKEIESLKRERDEKILEYQQLLDSERELLKQKIVEAEQKYKESESKRSVLLFDHEKERAKWNLEKDHISTQKNELQESLEKSERRKEALLRENERLKSENKLSRKSVNLFSTTANPNGSFIGKSKMIPESPLNRSMQSSKKLSISTDRQLKDITNFSSFLYYDTNKSISTEEDENRL